MRRGGSAGVLLPLALAVAGGTLILLGQVSLGPAPGPSLAPIPDSGTPVAAPSVTPGPATSTTPLPTPAPPVDWVARQLQVESVGVNVRVEAGTDVPGGGDVDVCCAFILSGSSQPGRGTNSYIVAHAQPWLFKPLWNVVIGAEVKILMSDNQVLSYRVTEIHPNRS